VEDITKKTLAELLFSKDKVVRNHALGILKELQRMSGKEKKDDEKESRK